MRPQLHLLVVAVDDDSQVWVVGQEPLGELQPADSRSHPVVQDDHVGSDRVRRVSPRPRHRARRRPHVPPAGDRSGRDRARRGRCPPRRCEPSTLPRLGPPPLRATYTRSSNTQSTAPVTKTRELGACRWTEESGPWTKRSDIPGKTVERAARGSRRLSKTSYGDRWIVTTPGTEVSPEQAAREEELVELVVRSFDGCEDPRLQELMVSLARHLHSYIREVRLTAGEWNEAIAFLTRTGHVTDDRRQEFILLSDVLGASMQTIAVNNEALRGRDRGNRLRSVLRRGITRGRQSAATSPFGAVGEPCWVEGTVTDIEAARCRTHASRCGRPMRTGSTTCSTTTTGSPPAPTFTPTRKAATRSGRSRRRRTRSRHDGPVGQLLDGGRALPDAGRTPALHGLVPGLRTLVTHIFVRGDALLESDAVFGVKESLVKDFDRQPEGTTTPDGRVVEGTWSRTASTSSSLPRRRDCRSGEACKRIAHLSPPCIAPNAVRARPGNDVCPTAWRRPTRVRRNHGQIVFGARPT